MVYTRRSKLSRVLFLTLTLVMTLTLVPAQAAGIDGHWSANAVSACRSYGVLDGMDESYDPNAIITRAEFCAMINRAFGYIKTDGAETFSDVDYGDKYGEDVKIASAMGYIEGYGSTFGPTDALTREMAIAILGRIYLLTGDAKATTKFIDDDQISDWARADINAMSGAGYVNGMGDGRLAPVEKITKGQAAQVLYNMFGEIADKDIDGGTYQNVTIRNTGITVKNAVVNGDLFITAGVGAGDAILENVTVKGRLVVCGGGPNSLRICGNTSVDEVYAGVSELTGPLRVSVSNPAEVALIHVGAGSKDVIIEGIIKRLEVGGNAAAVLENAAVNEAYLAEELGILRVNENSSVQTLYCRAADAYAYIAGKVDKIFIFPEAVRQKIETGKTALIAEIDSQAYDVNISGIGNIKFVNVRLGKNVRIKLNDYLYDDGGKTA